MKHILSAGFLVLALSFIMATVSYGQVRKSKEVSKLVKKAPRTEAFRFAVTVTTDGKQSHYDFVSLKDIDREKLTDVEKKLLETFADVAFCFNGGKVHCCYWVKDTDGKLGLMKFDGSILVPPKGNIYHGTLPSRVLTSSMRHPASFELQIR